MDPCGHHPRLEHERFWYSFPRIPQSSSSHVSHHCCAAFRIGKLSIPPDWSCSIFQGILKYSLGHKRERNSSYLLKAPMQSGKQIPLLMNTYMLDFKDSLILIVFKANYKIIKAFLNITIPHTVRRILVAIKTIMNWGHIDTRSPQNNFSFKTVYILGRLEKLWLENDWVVRCKDRA